MFRSRRAIATASFLVVMMLGSVAIYLVNAQSVNQEVIVRQVSGTLEGNNLNLSLGYFYPNSGNGLIFFKQSQSFYVYLYFSGYGTVESVSVTTAGFVGSVIAPYLPLTVANSTDPTVAILEVTAFHCCFNGTMDFAVNAT